MVLSMMLINKCTSGVHSCSPLASACAGSVLEDDARRKSTTWMTYEVCLATPTRAKHFRIKTETRTDALVLADIRAGMMLSVGCT
jgi:hypothetical protein